MTKLKRYLSLGAVLLVMGATSVTAFAASIYTTPAEAAAGLTGKTVESINEELKSMDKTYVSIANEAGKLEEFKSEVIKIKKSVLDQNVASGSMTQEQADAWLKSYEERVALCDGTGSACVIQGAAGCGQRNVDQGVGGCGQGIGGGRGMGCGRGNN